MGTFGHLQFFLLFPQCETDGKTKKKTAKSSPINEAEPIPPIIESLRDSAPTPQKVLKNKAEIGAEFLSGAKITIFRVCGFKGPRVFRGAGKASKRKKVGGERHTHQEQFKARGEGTYSAA